MTCIIALFIGLAPLCVFAQLDSAAVSTAGRIAIVSPGPRSVITTNEIYIRVETDVPEDSVAFVEFRTVYGTRRDVGYDSNYRMTAILDPLGRDSTAPYEWIWDLLGIEDHDHHRARIFATAVLIDGAEHLAVADDFAIDRNTVIPEEAITYSRYHHDPRTILAAGNQPPFFRGSNNLIRHSSAWNRDSLFFQAVVEDDSISSHLSDSSYWLGDGLEFFIDLHLSRSSLCEKGMFQLITNPDGRGYGIPLCRTDTSLLIAVASRRIRQKGYEITCAVAWSTLGISPRRGMKLGFDITNFDRDQADGIPVISTWMGLTRFNHHNASEWGILVLKGSSPFGALAIAAMLTIVGVIGVAFLVRRPKKSPEISTEISTKACGHLTAHIMTIVEEQYTDGSLSMKSIAKKLDKNAQYLSALFRKETGMRFTDHLNAIRLAHAKDLLIKTAKPVTAISAETGYNSYAYFVRLFRRKFGMTPLEMRNSK